MSASVLIVEDDPNLREGLHYNLNAEGYDVASVGHTVDADALLAQRPFHVVILDVMLPGEDGYAWCRKMRARGLGTMVLMLTARTLEDDVVRGFDAGAHDYVTKPYRLRELLARVKALALRAHAAGSPPPTPTGASDTTFEFCEFSLDLTKRLLVRRHSPNSPIDLTRTEFDLLAYLLKNRDRALTRDEMLDHVWGREVVVDPRTVDNFISSLKKKLAWSPASKFHVHTIRGVGYRFEITEDSP